MCKIRSWGHFCTKTLLYGLKIIQIYLIFINIYFFNYLSLSLYLLFITILSLLPIAFILYWFFSSFFSIYKIIFYLSFYFLFFSLVKIISHLFYTITVTPNPYPQLVKYFFYCFFISFCCFFSVINPLLLFYLFFALMQKWPFVLKFLHFFMHIWPVPI